MKYFSIIFTVACLVLFTTILSAQTIWTKYQGNPVLVPGSPGTWNDNSIYGVGILFDGNIYHMWYAGYDGNAARIGYATSPYGLTWTPNSGNPILNVGTPGSWDDVWIHSPYVLFDGNTYHMWYTGYDGTIMSIGYATSPDGITWTKYAGNPIFMPTPGSWNSIGVQSPCIIFDGSIYHMWYHGDDGSTLRIGYATSPDGISWTNHPNNPVLTPSPGMWDGGTVLAPDVFFDGTIFHMWYSGNSADWEDRIGYATSSDGITWHKFSYNPVLEVGETGIWDSKYVTRCRVIMDTATSTYKMWYHGGVQNNQASMGYATSPIVINVPGDVPTIQAGIDSASDGNIVLVDEGTYYENINFKGKAITVASRFLVNGDTNHINNTIIDGSQPTNPDSGSVVYFISGEDTNSVLKGFTITGGTGTKYTWASLNMHGGGGLYILSGGKVENNKIINNHLTNAGNIYTHGAGLDISSERSLVIRNNIIAQNSIDAWWGGGAGLALGCRDTVSIIFENNRLISNVYQANGGHSVGGIYCWSGVGWQGNILIKDNLIKGNQGYSTGSYKSLGGGIYIEDTSPILINNIFTDNHTNGDGGAIHIVRLPSTGYSVRPIIINNTINNNFAALEGGGIYVERCPDTTIIINTILWGDSATMSGNEIHVNSGQIKIMYSNVEGGWTGFHNMNIDPLLHDSLMAPNDTMFCCLTPNSPCIDAGNPDPSSYDLEDPQNLGYALWPAMGTLRNDMGAYGGHGRTDIIVGIKKNDNMNQISHYQLSQNYPNPFNPSTTIEFNLPKTSEVTLKVFNILGEEVVTLVSDRLSAGSYSYEWDATNLASGVYLYRLQAGDYVETRKMVLMR